MKAPARPPRRFAVATGGVTWELTSYQATVEHMGVPPDVVAGLDLLVDDGMPVDKAAALVGAEHRDGRDAEAFARHLLRLRRAARSTAAGRTPP
jgi:hypothetical protein